MTNIWCDTIGVDRIVQCKYYLQFVPASDKIIFFVFINKQKTRRFEVGKETTMLKMNEKSLLYDSTKVMNPTHVICFYRKKEIMPKSQIISKRDATNGKEIARKLGESNRIIVSLLKYALKCVCL